MKILFNNNNVHILLNIKSQLFHLYTFIVFQLIKYIYFIMNMYLYDSNVCIIAYITITFTNLCIYT